MASARFEPDAAAESRVVLIIPTFNEEASIGQVVAEASRATIGRIIVADGGSSDATAERADKGGAEVLVVGRGYGRACLAAAEAASDADILVFMDGDGADDPSLLPNFVGPIAQGTHDFVIGSRTRGQPAKGSMGWHQRVAGRAFGVATRMIYGTKYTDMCAFRAIRREALLDLGMREMTYGWNLEMQMRIARRKLRVLELPVDNRHRLGGESKVAGSLSGSIKAGTRITATFFRVALVPDRARGPHGVSS